MKLINLADYLYQDIGEPTDTTITDIIFILRNLCGDLNNIISTQYTIVDQEYCPELGEDESSILGNLYLIRYYNRLIKQNLGAAAYGWSELREGDSVIRTVSNNEIAKTYLQLKNTIQEQLTKMAEFYKKNRCLPVGWGYNYCDCKVTSGANCECDN